MDIEQSYPQPDGMVSIFSIAYVPLTPVPTLHECSVKVLCWFNIESNTPVHQLYSSLQFDSSHERYPIHWVIENCTIICNSAVHERGTSIAGARVVIDARAGIRTRVGGMKTHYDGPGYTTRATAVPPTTP